MALLVAVKPPREFASDGAHFHPGLPSLQRAFVRVLHSPVLGSSTKA